MKMTYVGSQSQTPHDTCCANEGFPLVRTQKCGEITVIAFHTIVCACQIEKESIPYSIIFIFKVVNHFKQGSIIQQINLTLI